MTTTATTTPTVAPARLTLVRRIRVLARRALFAGLRAVPAVVVTALHDRWIDPAGERDARWRAVAAVLFYRPVPLDVMTVPGPAGDRLAVVGTRLERSLWWWGEDGYEGGEAGSWRALCAEATNVLELGANIGYYSVVGARATAGAYTAVEPNPEAAAIVRRNLAINGLDRAEVVAAAAVGAGAPDHLELALPDQEAHSTAPTGSYLREGTEGVAETPATRSVRVPTISAAALFADRDLVKLDIEGSEAAVLEAAREEIRRSRPVLLVEVLPGADRLRAVIEELTGEGYRVRLPRSPGDVVRPDELGLGGYEDVLLVPAERDHVG